jgi:hypothetical protein
MSQTAVANTVGFLFSALTLAGATGITAQDVQGFVTVIGAIVTAACFIWSHISHRSALTAATGSTASTA